MDSDDGFEGSQPKTAQSSPLTDVRDLNDYPSSDSDAPRSPRTDADLEGPSYAKKRTNHTSESSSKKDECMIKDEEGVLLPGRKRPIPYSQINQKDRSGRTLIFKYASRGDVETSEALLEAGASLRIADNAGWTPLHEACLEGHDEIVKLMLAFDAEVDSLGGDGDTPLHDAVGNTHTKVVRLLLQNGASIDLINEQGQTALEFAIEKLKENEDEISSNKIGLVKTQRDEAERIVKLLAIWKKMTSKVVKRDLSGQTMLHKACTKNNISKVVELLEYGADINVADNSGWTPIHNAALNGNAEILETLLKFGSFVDPIGIDGETPLHDAVANGHSNCASYLLQYGAEPFRKNRRAQIPRDLIPDGNTKLKELLDRPLEFWQPVKSAEYYPKLLSQCPVDCKPKRPVDERSFAWGGLDDRHGPFESGREEKKFKALWQTITRDDTPSAESSNNFGSVVESRTKALSSSENTDYIYRKNIVEPSSKFELDSKKISDNNGSISLIIGFSDRNSKSLKPKFKSKSHTVPQELSNNSYPLDKIQPKNTYSIPHNPQRIHPAKHSIIPTVIQSNAILHEDKIDYARQSFKKKRRFAISGYQRAGSEILPDYTGQKIDPVEMAPFLKVISDPSNAQEIDENAAEAALCLPLCAYIIPGLTKFAHAKLPALTKNQVRVFVDLQLAFCLGFKSGRALLECHPTLDFRVATNDEKVAIESSVLSYRLLKSMLCIMDRSWIKTITVNGLESLKVTDLDLHIVYWNEELSSLVCEKRVEDIKTVIVEVAKIEIEPEKVYVHRLKRSRAQ